MTATIAVVGMLVLFGLAAAAGAVDAGSQRSAWNRIAAGRRELGETRRELEEYEVSLAIRGSELDARERRLRTSESRLDDWARALELRERAVARREQGTTHGPDAA